MEKIKIEAIIYYDGNGDDKQEELAWVDLASGSIEYANDDEEHLVDKYPAKDLIVTVKSSGGGILCRIMDGNSNNSMINAKSLMMVWNDYSNGEVEPVYCEVIESNGESDYCLKSVKLKPVVASLDAFAIVCACMHCDGDYELEHDSAYGSGVYCSAEVQAITQGEYDVLFKYLHNGGM